MSSRRVLVTGGRGFVGRRLVEALQQRGASVLAPPRTGDNELDLQCQGTIERHLREFSPDAVIHLGAMTHLPEVLSKPDLAFDINVMGTWRLIDSVARVCPSTKVILVSTCSVFGSPSSEDLPLKESHPRRSTHPYGVQKIALEDMGERFAADRGLNIVIARPFNHVGPGPNTRFAVGFFAREIARIEAGRGEPLMRVGNLEPRREILHVDDVVAAYISLLEAGSATGVYNIASGESVRIGDALDHLVRNARVCIAIDSDPSLFRPMDAPDLAGDSSRIRQEFGWKPAHVWRETLVEILEDARAREAGVT